LEAKSINFIRKENDLLFSQEESEVKDLKRIMPDFEKQFCMIE
jgi:hypothetical protein